MTNEISPEVLGDLAPIPGDSTPDVPASISTILASLASAIDALSVQDLSLGTVTASSIGIGVSGGAGITLGAASSVEAGLMSSADKTLLEGTATNTLAAITAGLALNAAIIRLQTLSGVAAEANNLGAFAGATIGDNVSIKQAIQALETAVETASSGATNLSAGTNTAASLVIQSDTGTNVTLGQATESLAGLMNATDKSKVNNLTVTQPVDLDALGLAVESLTTGGVPTPPTVPAYVIPVEDDCHIIVDAQNFEIMFRNGIAGTDVLAADSWSGLGLAGYSTGDLTTMAAGDGNPIGSANGELNLIAQAINMAVGAKTFEVDHYGYPIGRIIIGLKGGNGGGLALSYSNQSSSPAVRVNANAVDVWDVARNTAPYTAPIAGYDLAAHGMDVVIVALDEDAQMRFDTQGPQASTIYDVVDNPGGVNQATQGVQVFNMKLRNRSAPGSGQAYYSMVGPIDGDFIAEGNEFMPLDPTADGLAFNTLSGAKGNIGYDSKWGFLFNLDVTGDTILNHNGTSGDFPSTAMTQFNGAADDAVVFREHNYYCHGGGGLYVINHGQPRGATWPNKTLYPVHTNRTLFQTRPDATEDTLGRDGTILVKDNIVTNHGGILVTSTGEHPGSSYDGGGGVFTVWMNLNGQTWFVDNVVDDAYYNAITIDNQGASLDILNGFGFPIDEVFFSGNTFGANPLSVDTLRSTLILIAARKIHLLAGNQFLEGIPVATAMQINDGSVDTIRVGSIIQYAGFDPLTDIDSGRYYDGSTYQSIDLADPPDTVPEWFFAADFADYGPVPITSGVVTSAYLATAGETVLCNTTGGAFAVTLPAAPEAGDWVRVIDATSTASVNNITVSPNGNKFHSYTVNDTLSSVAARARYQFSGVTSIGWVRTA